MASVQRCAAQHPGRRAAETVCRQFQCPRLHFSRRHLRQIWLPWRHGLPLGTEIWGGEDAEFEPRCLRRTWRLSRFWPTTWKRNPSVSPAVAAFGSLNRRLRQQTATCVLRRLNTKHPPGKGPVAVGAGVLSLVAVRLPGSPLGGGPDGWCRAPRTACRAVSPGAFAASGGVSCLFLCCREVGGSFCAGPRRPSGPCAGGCPRGLAVVLHRVAVSRAPAKLCSTQEQEQPPGNTGNKLPQPPPKRKATLLNRRAPVAAVVGPEVAGGSRGRRDGRPCLP